MCPIRATHGASPRYMGDFEEESTPMFVSLFLKRRFAMGDERELVGLASSVAVDALCCGSECGACGANQSFDGEQFIGGAFACWCVEDMQWRAKNLEKLLEHYVTQGPPGG